MKYFEDYKNAGVPTFPSTYGYKKTRIIIAVSSLLAAIAIAGVAYGIGLSWGYLRLFAVLTVGIVGLAGFSVLKPSENINFGLFKYASIYMLGAMIMVIIGAS
jgi:heme O synthase-like polyprenyltransferase